MLFVVENAHKYAFLYQQNGRLIRNRNRENSANTHVILNFNRGHTYVCKYSRK